MVISCSKPLQRVCEAFGFSYEIQVTPRAGVESVNHVDINREGGMPTTEELAQIALIDYASGKKMVTCHHLLHRNY